MMRIAVIAPGMMGAGVAQRLRQRGADVAVTLAGRSPASAKRAAGLAVKDSETALAQWADVVLSILPPGDADFPSRWRSIKTLFSRRVAHSPDRRPSLVRKREAGVWRRR